jgi:SAM-dependent methyltransferase
LHDSVRSTHSKVVYDVGLYNGDDTAYYLFQGYKVVAIDANPLMIEEATSRFAKEIDDGRLTLLKSASRMRPASRPSGFPS